jgi:prophage maintenance system killer protein
LVVDGNKRIAFIALGIILEPNGFYLDAREADAAS